MDKPNTSNESPEYPGTVPLLRACATRTYPWSADWVAGLLSRSDGTAILAILASNQRRQSGRLISLLSPRFLVAAHVDRKHEDSIRVYSEH